VLEPSDSQVWGDRTLATGGGIYFQMPSSSLLLERVEVRLEYVDSQVQIAVSDTGKGISADFLYVFDRFRQADSTSTRVHKGRDWGWRSRVT